MAEPQGSARVRHEAKIAFRARIVTAEDTSWLPDVWTPPGNPWPVKYTVVSSGRLR
jgi:hypothetical protein